MNSSGIPEKPQTGILSRVFLSYSRRDIQFAAWLRDQLEASGIEVLRDLDDTLPGEEWWKRLKELITKADTIVFVLSPRSVGSKVCRDEVTHASTKGKRIFPVVIEPVNWTNVPGGLAKLHSVYFTGGADWQEPLASLREALLTDIDWVREHSRLAEIAGAHQSYPGPKGAKCDIPGRANFGLSTASKK